MKWKNKGHEFDQIGNSMKEKYQEGGVWIWGAGIIGTNLGKKLLRFNCLKGFIDQDVKKQRTGWLDKKVVSIDGFLAEKKGILIIAASRVNSPVMEEKLREAGLRKNEDYFLAVDFDDIYIKVFYAYCLGMSYVEVAQIVLTERCTLKCLKCAHGCYNAMETVDMTFEEVCRTADIFFSKVDYIEKFVLIGGEPLLYKMLPETVGYIGEKYREKMGIFSIETNGTILPDEALIEAIKKYDVLYEISDYTVSIPHLRKRYERLEEILIERNIEYIFYKHKFWIDYGLDGEVKHNQEDELINVFDQCKTPCREIRGNRFYFCVQARTVSDNLEFYEGREDYLDLLQLREDRAKIMLEFNLGYCEKGYLEMCKRCNGSERMNPFRIPVAEQIDRGNGV